MAIKETVKKSARNVKKLFVEFASKRSIHGIRYLVEPNRTTFEKLCWAIVVLISLLGCSKMILDIWTRYHDNPVMMSIGDNPIPYWEIPFPAITICPEGKADVNYFDIAQFLTPFLHGRRVQENITEMQEHDRMKLTTLSQICKNIDFKGFDPKNQTDCSQCLSDIKGIGIWRQRLIGKCVYNQFCEQLFEDTYTDEGLCFTFNSLKMEDIFRMESLDVTYRLLQHSREAQWSPETGYSPNATLDTYPLRAIPNGDEFGLDLRINVEFQDFQPLCRDNLDVKLALHAPNEIPQMTKYFQKLPLDHEVILTVEPQIMTTDDNLRGYSPFIRQCFFNNERFLEYFKIYTQQNCRLECLTNLTLATCGCVQFYMPRGPGVKVCGIGELECCLKVRQDVSLVLDQDGPYDPNQCNCWPACMSVTYKSKTSQVEIKGSKNIEIEYHTKFVHLTILNKQESVFAKRKYEIFGPIDLISQWGGLLGLFMGISLLSILEILYYFTLRIVCSLKVQHQRKIPVLPMYPNPNICLEYIDQSSIHGVPYLAERNRPMTETLFWAIVLAISLTGCGILITDLYTKWQENPVVISVSEKPTPIWKIPFPAVTICPEAKTDSDLFNINAELAPYINRGMTNEDFDLVPDGNLRTRLIAVSQVCLPQMFSSMVSGRPNECSKCLTALRDISLTKKSIFNRCSYLGKNCDDFFHEIITDEGICYSFNTLKMTDIFRDETIIGDYNFLNHSLKSDQWSMEAGYTPDAPLQTFPFRALGIGLHMGVNIDLTIDVKHFDSFCRGFKPISYRMVLHGPNEIPQLSTFYQKLPTNSEVIVTIRPKIVVSEDKLRSYRPELRQCFFNNERRLRYFKLYTQQNCMTECLTNFTLEHCDCVRIHMPRHKGVRICALNDLKCTGDSVLILRNQLIEQERFRGSYDPLLCNCWPACTTITYEVETNQVSLDEDFLSNESRSADQKQGVELNRISFLFKEAQFFASKRSELFGPTDFFANCGGLLGLFMGVSLLSIVEIIYFFSIRLICIWCQSRTQK